MTESRRRGLLLLSIVLVVGVTIALKVKLTERESAVGDESPVARANAALSEASRAATSEDMEGVERHLGTAAAALDEALEEKPGDLEAARARLAVARRRAAVSERRGRAPEAIGRLRTALQLATRLHERSPTASRGRLDRLDVARALTRTLLETGNATAASETARTTLDAIEATLAGTRPGPPVRALLARLWLQLAKARRTNFAAASEALDRAVAHAEADDGDPVEATARLHIVLATAVGMSDASGRAADALRYERRLVQVLELKAKLVADPASTRRVLARRLARLAGRLEGAQAQPLHEKALAVRRALLKAQPDDAALRRDVAKSLNHLGALHSSAGRDEAAIQAYADAARNAEGLTGPLRRTRLVALGFQAHLLGKLDRMVASKAVAAQAYTLAVDLAAGAPTERRAGLDAVAAGLRHARLARAKPKPDRPLARKVAQTERARLEALPKPHDKRVASLRAGLDEVLRELN